MGSDLFSIKIIDQFHVVRTIDVAPNTKIGYLNQYFSEQMTFYYHDVKLQNKDTFATYEIEADEVIYAYNPNITKAEILEELRYRKKLEDLNIRAAELNPKLYYKLLKIYTSWQDQNFKTQFPEETNLSYQKGKCPSCDPLPCF